MIDLVSDWLVDQYPADERPPGTTVRTREGTDDPVFRFTITESVPNKSHVQTITITVMYVNSALTFDLRSVSSPTTDRVVRHRSNPLPKTIADLVRNALRIAPVYDAEEQVKTSTTVASTELQGQTIAALALAPRRKLPLLIEFTDYERQSTPVFGGDVGPLAGLVHQYRITTPEALNGFLDIFGGELIVPGTVVVIWADKSEIEKSYLREMTAQNHAAERIRLWQLIIDNAARSIASPRVPPPPVRLDDDEVEQTETSTRSTVVSATHSDAEAELEALSAQIKSLESTIDGLEAAVADGDRMIADMRADLERTGKLTDDLVSRNVALEMQVGSETTAVKTTTTMREAIDRARNMCEFLVFHERAIESGLALEGPDPSSVLLDLLRLNNVARAWMSAEISGHSIGLACRREGLNFASTVSDTARQKFSEDYAITWRGKTVLAEAHIKRGKKSHLVRIHVYFDEETQQVVVAYIGRHLRGRYDH